MRLLASKKWLVAATVLTAVLLAVVGGTGGVGFATGPTFSGTNESERYVGTNNVDTLIGVGGKDFLRGGGGDDLYGDADEDTLVGDEPTDNGSDTIHGGDGIDEVVGGPGNDYEYGGAGNDLMGSMDYRDRDGPLIEDTGSDRIRGEDGDDFIKAGPGADLLFGGAGADNLLGGSEDDSLYPGLGDDVLDGEAGTDLAVYTGRDFTTGMTVNLAAGTSTGGQGTDILQNMEGVHGSSFDDAIIGSSAVNYLYGSSGNDKISGGAGRDDIYGSSGADTIKARDNEADTIECGEGDGDESVTQIIDKVQADELDTIATDCEFIDPLGGPTATITAGPAAGSTTRSTTANFAFSASQEGSFQCSLDGGAFVDCSSGTKAYTGLSSRQHTFSVKATDAFGETGAAASRTWKVDAVAPRGSVKINNGAKTTKSLRAKLTLKAADNLSGSGVSQMCVSNTTRCTAWRPYSTSISWNLVSGKAGTRTVYVRYKDRVGNVSVLYKDTIKYAP